MDDHSKGAIRVWADLASFGGTDVEADWIGDIWTAVCTTGTTLAVTFKAVQNRIRRAKR